MLPSNINLRIDKIGFGFFLVHTIVNRDRLGKLFPILWGVAQPTCNSLQIHVNNYQFCTSTLEVTLYMQHKQTLNTKVQSLV